MSGKSSEYEARAASCAALAVTFPPGPDRDHLFRLAAIWAQMAADRAKLLKNHPELDQPAQEIGGKPDNPG